MNLVLIPARDERFCFLHSVNPLNAELNAICHFLALLGAHRILHVSRIRVKTGYGIHAAS